MPCSILCLGHEVRGQHYEVIKCIANVHSGLGILDTANRPLSRDSSVVIKYSVFQLLNVISVSLCSE